MRFGGADPTTAKLSGSDDEKRRRPALDAVLTMVGGGRLMACVRRAGRSRGVARDRVLLFDVSALAVRYRDVGEVEARPVRHRPHGLGGVAVLDRAGRHAPLVLQRIAVGIAGATLRYVLSAPLSRLLLVLPPPHDSTARAEKDPTRVGPTCSPDAARTWPPFQERPAPLALETSSDDSDRRGSSIAIRDLADLPAPWLDICPSARGSSTPNLCWLTRAGIQGGPKRVARRVAHGMPRTAARMPPADRPADHNMLRTYQAQPAMSQQNDDEGTVIRPTTTSAGAPGVASPSFRTEPARPFESGEDNLSLHVGAHVGEFEITRRSAKADSASCTWPGPFARTRRWR